MGAMWGMERENARPAAQLSRCIPGGSPGIAKQSDHIEYRCRRRAIRGGVGHFSDDGKTAQEKETATGGGR
jgi:hypothetical protein